MQTCWLRLVLGGVSTRGWLSLHRRINCCRRVSGPRDKTVTRKISQDCFTPKIDSVNFRRETSSGNSHARTRSNRREIAPGLVRQHATFRQAVKLAKQFAAYDVPVLITGETGTGKEEFAKLIHFSSPRAKHPFFPVNCAGISETLAESELFGHVVGAFTGATKPKQGIFELAGNGSVFLDEVGELPLTIQAKLLRVLEDGTFMRLVLEASEVCGANHCGDQPRPRNNGCRRKVSRRLLTV